TSISWARRSQPCPSSVGSSAISTALRNGPCSTPPQAAVSYTGDTACTVSPSRSSTDCSLACRSPRFDPIDKTTRVIGHLPRGPPDPDRRAVTGAPPRLHRRSSAESELAACALSPPLRALVCPA